MSRKSLERPGAPLTLAEVAELVGGRLAGSASATASMSGVTPLEDAGPDELGFLAAKRYVRYLATSRAGAYLVDATLENLLPKQAPRVVVEAPHAALRALLVHFHPAASVAAEVHPSAVIGRGVRLGLGVRVEPFVVLGDSVAIGDGARIGAHCVLGPRTSVGARSVLHPHVVTYADSAIGADVILHSGVRIGSDGFGYTRVDGVQVKMPQVGRAVVEDDVEIGANSTIDRGSLGDTLVGKGVKVDNLVQIAHNVRVGAATMIAALVGIAGSTRIGRGAWIGGRACAANHLEIGDGARITFGSTVLRDVPPDETVSGYPARPHREQLRAQAHSNRLPDRVERLEGALSALQASPRSIG